MNGKMASHVFLARLYRTLMPGYTLLPRFSAKTIVKQMLKENYCLDSATNGVVLAKVPDLKETHYMYASDVPAYMLAGWIPGQGGCGARF